MSQLGCCVRKMTRKRFTKLLMSYGIGRNFANLIASIERNFGSYWNQIRIYLPLEAGNGSERRENNK